MIQHKFGVIFCVNQRKVHRMAVISPLKIAKPHYAHLYYARLKKRDPGVWGDNFPALGHKKGSPTEKSMRLRKIVQNGMRGSVC